MRTRLSLIVGDILLAIGANLLAHMVLGIGIGGTHDLFHIPFFGIVLVFASLMLEFYGIERFMPPKELVLRIPIALIIGFLLLSSLHYMVPALMLERKVLVLAVCIFGIAQLLWHLAHQHALDKLGLSKRVLILGTGSLAKKIGDVITSTNCRHTVAGYITMDSAAVKVPGDTVVGTSNTLYDTVKREKAQRLVISLSERRGTLPLQDILKCKFEGVDVVDAPSFYEEVTGKLLIENITPSWFIFCDALQLTQLKRILKRSADIGFALIGLILSAVMLPFIALAIRIDSQGPVFFRQVRVGERGRQFVLYKFRTMRVDAESVTGAVWAQRDDPRVTRIGKFLRKTRLDELPQLFNVLTGDMSLIGPRPERPEFIEGLSKIIPFYSERHAVKPGLTGWAQIRYPYGSSVDDAIEKLRYDLFYIKNMSFFFDMGIILETIKVVMFGRGAR